MKDKIRKKLRLWASVKLALEGRVVVVNHILLVTMWHSLACWMLDKDCIKNIKPMVRGFLWSGRDHETALAKVAWSCLVKAKNQWGLGMVDSARQSKALLGKLLVQVSNMDQNCGSCFFRTELNSGVRGMVALGRQRSGSCSVRA